MTDAYVHIVVDAGAVGQAIQQIKNIDGVADAHVVTGEFDIIAQLELADPNDLPWVVADEIHAVPGVIETVTNVAYDL